MFCKNLKANLCRVFTQILVNRNVIQVGLFVFGAFALVTGLTQLGIAQGEPTTVEFDTEEIESAICDLLNLTEGSFGALLTTVAGIGALVASAFGAYKAAYSLLVTGVSAFIISSMVSLWFGTFDCGGNRYSGNNDPCPPGMTCDSGTRGGDDCRPGDMSCEDPQIDPSPHCDPVTGVCNDPTVPFGSTDPIVPDLGGMTPDPSASDPSECDPNFNSCAGTPVLTISPYDFDGNGDTDVADSQFLMNVATGLQSCPLGMNCDLNGDGQVNTSDALFLQEYLDSNP